MKTGLCVAAVAGLALTSPAWSQATSGSEYVAMAGAGDLYEKTSSQLILTSTKDAKVRSFAQMMVADHSKSTSEVKAAAMQAKIRVAPAKLNPEQTKMVAELRAVNGAARDEAYITQQKAAHQSALALQSSYSQDGTVAQLKAVATKIVPVVQHHIELLQAM